MNTEFSDDDFSSMLKSMEDEQKKDAFQSQYWKPTNEGTYYLRIITPLKSFGEKLFYQHRKMHYIGQKAYYCLNQTLTDKDGNEHVAEACPICAKSKALYSNSTQGTEEWAIAGSLRAKDRYVSRVVVRGKKTPDGKDDEAKPEFWEFGKKIYQYFFDTIKLGEAGNFLSLKDGRDYLLSKKGTGRNTDYSGSSLSMKTSAVFTDPEKCKQLLGYLGDMDYSKLVEFRPAEELKAALAEMFNEAVEPTPVVNNTAPVDTTPLDDPFSQPAASVSPVAAATAQAEESIDDILNMI